MPRRQRNLKLFYNMYGNKNANDGVRPISKNNSDEQRADPQSAAGGCAEKNGSGQVEPGDGAPTVNKNVRGDDDGHRPSGK